jgi:hypothetical protein
VSLASGDDVWRLPARDIQSNFALAMCRQLPAARQGCGDCLPLALADGCQCDAIAWLMHPQQSGQLSGFESAGVTGSCAVGESGLPAL